MPEALPKLPQARMYLNTAKWGIDRLVADRLQGQAFRLYIIGILASLRAVQHALLNHDSQLTDAHRKVVAAWQSRTPLDGPPELAFIVLARNQMLKAGRFESYAVTSQSRIGEGDNETVTSSEYDLAYYVDGVRHDLLAELHRAANWCSLELTAIEDELPDRTTD